VRPPRTSGGRGWAFGTSVVLNGPWADASGWDGGLGTSFLVDPARALAVARPGAGIQAT
jgi:CubicO group peptidase (beta-lactamase class C family)